MKRALFGFPFLFFFASVCAAQKGTAEPDYYPMGYFGETFSGEITSANEETRELTLTYATDKKTQTFVGVLGKGYTIKMKDGRDYEVKMANLPGMRIKAFYMTASKKNVDGVKVQTNGIFKIKFLPKE